MCFTPPATCAPRQWTQNRAASSVAAQRRSGPAPTDEDVDANDDERPVCENTCEICDGGFAGAPPAERADDRVALAPFVPSGDASRVDDAPPVLLSARALADVLERFVPSLGDDRLLRGHGRWRAETVIGSVAGEDEGGGRMEDI